MLEWLLRKTFKIDEPDSHNKNRNEEPQETTRIEPVLDPQKPVSDAPVGTGGSSANYDFGGRQASAVHGAAQSSEAPGKVNIFNFKAWFMADPVKAALTLGLAFLSWLATYTGMLELIQANSGSLDIGARVAIGFAVMMLMLMILYLLDSLYSGATPKWLKPIFVFGYLFLTLISVGFGFGFYWKYLEAQTEATRSAESAVSQVQVSLQLGQTRLEQLQDTFAQLAVLSKNKADQERQFGNSCPNSRPGEGPRMRLRDEDSQKFGYAADYINSRAGGVKTDLNALNTDLQKVVTRDPGTISADGTRNEFLRGLGRKLDLTIARFNALATDPQIRQFRDNFDKRAGMTVFPTGTGNATFRCPDTQLQTALRGVVRAIDDIPEIKNPKIAAVEGSEAIVEAFRRLAVTLAALPTLKLPPSPEELRKRRTEAISAGKAGAEVSNIEAGLSQRDYIPLSAAMFVDLCILLISLNRRYDNFEKFHHSVASAEAGEIGNTMLEIFEAHQNKFSQEMLEIFHHAEFEFGRDYYLAVPLIKGSREALYYDQLQQKEDEIARSKMDALDERIGLHENELQRRVADQVEAERMKKQVVDYINSLVNHRARLLQHQRQLALSYKGQPQQTEVSQQAEKLTAEIANLNTQLTTFNKKLEDSGRLLHGTTELVKQTRNEISGLKHKRTQLHEDERLHLRKKMEIKSQLDLAKEARFLSNLCVSLEANDVLHLAGFWPMPHQVRAQLKKHNSRYYGEGRNYRVYRFRKVADTQSQMVLDLIMEAAKRARANGEAQSHEATKMGLSREEFSLRNEIENERRDLAREREATTLASRALESQMNALRDEMRSEMREGLAIVGNLFKESLLQQQEAQAQNQAQAQTAPPPPFERDTDAVDVNFREISRKYRATSDASNSALREIYISGITDTAAGNTFEELTEIMKKKIENPDQENEEEAPVAVAVSTDDKAKGKKRKIRLGSKSRAKTKTRTKVVEDGVADPRDRVNVDSLAAPRSDEAQKPPEDVSPEPVLDASGIAIDSDTAFKMVADKVGKGRSDDGDAEPVENAAGPETEAEAESENISEQKRKLQESISGRLARFRMDNELHDRGHKAAVYRDLLDPQQYETNVDAETSNARQEEHPSPNEIRKRLVGSVQSDTANDLNQDPDDRYRLEPTFSGERNVYDEPSEADKFVEGEMPEFLRKDKLLDEVSEESGTRTIAERFRPTTKGD